MQWPSVLKIYKVFLNKIYILKVLYNVLAQHCPVEFIFYISNEHTSSENICNEKPYSAVYTESRG